MAHEQAWQIAGETINSRLFLGTARYPSFEVMSQAIRASGAEVITVSLRREMSHSNNKAQGGRFWDQIKSLAVKVLPNTAGCYSVQEAVTTAQMARDLFGTSWIKLEVIGNDDTLQPDVFATCEAARILCEEGFDVFPYTTCDLVVAERLLSVGCKIIMPWAAPIGTGQGPTDKGALKTLRARLPEATLIVDAGIGLPSHAALVMEWGYDAVLLNTAIAQAANPVAMAEAFQKAIDAGRLAYLSGPMRPREHAVASTPLVDIPFWHHRNPVAGERSATSFHLEEQGMR